MDDIIKNRIKKIYALASEGIDGEKINAENMLDKFLRKYGFNIQDILDDKKRSSYEFRYKTKNERVLLIHIYMKVRPEVDDFFYYQRNRKIELELNSSEYVEMKIMWNVYKKELRKQLEITFLAFLKSQNLFRTSQNKTEKEINSEELQKWVAIYKRSDEIDEIRLLKELSQNENRIKHP